MATSQPLHLAFVRSSSTVLGLPLTLRPSGVHPNAVKQSFTSFPLGMCSVQFHLLIFSQCHLNHYFFTLYSDVVSISVFYGAGSLALPPIPNLEDQGVTLLLDLFGIGGPTKLLTAISW